MTQADTQPRPPRDEIGWPRPIAHFTPRRGWMNDPNGLIRVGDEYHLYFQHNPDAVTWGNIHWGHATSRNLVEWIEHDVALAPDHLGEIFSGSIVIDHDDTAGLGPGAMIAVFTHDDAGRQVQSLASSVDGGATFRKFPLNPVLVADQPDFRDPKVVRYVGDEGAWWTMLLSVGTEIWFYRSDDLVEWVRTFTVAPPAPAESLIEVPDLVQVADPSGGRTWLMLYSVSPPTWPASGERHVAWCVGSFDGLGFSSTDGGLVDHGPHFYAPTAWEDHDGEPVAIGWMNEEEAPGGHHGGVWCGRHSIPRRLGLVERDGSVELTQHPVELDPLAVLDRSRYALHHVVGRSVESSCFAIEISGSADHLEIDLSGDDLETTVVVDRGDRIDLVVGDQRWTAPDPVTVTDGTWLLVDGGSIEVFSGARTRVLSALVGIGSTATTVSVRAEGDVDVGVEITQYGSA